MYKDSFSFFPRWKPPRSLIPSKMAALKTVHPPPGIRRIRMVGFKDVRSISCENTKIATSCWTTTNGRLLERTKKRYPTSRTKEKPQWDGRRGAITLKSNPVPARDPRRAQTRPCVHQDQGKGAVIPPTKKRDRVRPACECLTVSCGGVGQQWPTVGTGALAAATPIRRRRYST